MRNICKRCIARRSYAEILSDPLVRTCITMLLKTWIFRPTRTTNHVRTFLVMAIEEAKP